MNLQRLNYVIIKLVNGLQRIMGPYLLVLARLLIFTVPFAVFGQASAEPPVQDHGNVQGYTCNGLHRKCDTFAFYRTYQKEDSLAKVAAYFNVSVDDVGTLNNLTTTSSLSENQALYIPISCSCSDTVFTSQMEVLYTIAKADIYETIASNVYSNLTTSEAMIILNPMQNQNGLIEGETIKVPIFCACPTALQIDLGASFLLTYTIGPGDTVDSISSFFGVTTDKIYSAQRFFTDRPEENTTLLVPLASGPLPRKDVSSHHADAVREVTMRRRPVGIVAGASAAAAAVALLASGLIFAKFYWRREDKQSEKLEFSPDLVPRMFAFRELRKATGNFSRRRILGRGGFGAVYKGRLPSGAVVAVKQMRVESKHGKESFQAEVASLSRIRHRNLVQLRGWCHEEEQLLLVYDYMCNGSLDAWLFEFQSARRGVASLCDADALPLRYRHSILSGVAGALSYLHEDCSQCVLHRDIKSSNVLLDADLNAYVGDFGLARLIDHQKMARTTMMAGTLGYLAPEMPHTGKATKETDVYSFGILVLEVMCGTHPLCLTAIEQGDGLLEDRVWRAHEQGNILQSADAKLGSFPISNANSSDESMMSSSEMSDEDHDKKLITNLLQLGLLCCNPSPENRPSMRLVAQLMLQSVEEMEMSMPCLPEWKPSVQYSRPGFRGFSQAFS